MKFHLFFVALIASAMSGGTLYSQAKRVDLTIDRNSYVVSSGPMGSSAAFVCYYNSKPTGKVNAIEFITYDNTLKETGRVSSEVPVGAEYQASHSDSNGAYIVFGKSLSGDFTVLHYDGREVTSATGNFGPKGYCRFIRGFATGAVMECRDKKGNDFVSVYDRKAGSTRNELLNTSDPKADIAISSVQYLQLSDEIAVVYQCKTKELRQLKVQLFSGALAKTSEMMLSKATDKERYMMDATLSMVTAGEYIVNGTYQNEEGDYSNGMYIGSFTKGSFSTLKYYSWSNDFKHAMDYMSQKQKEKIEKKKGKAEAKGNEYDLDIRLIAHPLIQRGSDMVVVGEMYYPEYETYTDSKGVTTTTFVGYRYSQSIITSFTKDFSKNWDQSFAMGFLGGFRPVPTITVRNENNKVTCAFVVGSTLHYEVISDAGTVDKKTVTTFSIKDQGESVRYTSGSDITYWFGDSYLACGAVRKKDKSGDKENVYYLTIVDINKN
jgi:hypothetical protein